MNWAQNLAPSMERKIEFLNLPFEELDGENEIVFRQSIKSYNEAFGRGEKIIFLQSCETLQSTTWKRFCSMNLPNIFKGQFEREGNILFCQFSENLISTILK